MPSERAALALLDIRDNIPLARQFVAGMTFDAFEADLRTFCAVTRCVEIISEAARRLPASLRAGHPDTPWQAIMGAGNVYRHDHDNVDVLIVWGTVNHNLSPLLAVVEAEIAALPSA